MPQIQSLLPELEPMLGVAFALNLAYIGLARFRYRHEIRDFARKEMGDLAKDPPSNLAETSVYKAVARLSSLSPHDRKWHQRSHKNADLTGFWSGIYTWWFECHQDRFFMILCASLAACGISLGVAHKIQHLVFSIPMFGSAYINIWFWGTVALILLPVISVALGRYTVAGAQSYAIKNVQDLKRMMQGSVHKASVAAE